MSDLPHIHDSVVLFSLPARKCVVAALFSALAISTVVQSGAQTTQTSQSAPAVQGATPASSSNADGAATQGPSDSASSPTGADASRRHPASIEPEALSMDFLQYGVGIDSLLQGTPGAVCPERSEVPCMLGSGIGLTGRAGKRTSAPWYWGVSYGFDKINTNSLMKLGVLQHAEFELRYYVNLRKRAEPYLLASAGGLVFGNEWSIETVGAAMALGAGTELQISRGTLVALSINYRPMLFVGWTDKAGLRRATGLAQYWGLHIHFEAHEALGSH